VRAVLDVNVLISAVISSSGSPAKLVRAWAAVELELIVSPTLLEELRRALGYPKVARPIAADDAELLIAWLVRSATLARDAASPPPVRSSDPNDDHLIALAAEQRAVLVTGDRHLLGAAGSFPIREPEDFVAMSASVAWRRPYSPGHGRGRDVGSRSPTSGLA
jgi:putative PIN family toxin of toxin-antitoxin system